MLLLLHNSSENIVVDLVGLISMVTSKFLHSHNLISLQQSRPLTCSSLVAILYVKGHNIDCIYAGQMWDIIPPEVANTCIKFHKKMFHLTGKTVLSFILCLLYVVVICNYSFSFKFVFYCLFYPRVFVT